MKSKGKKLTLNQETLATLVNPGRLRNLPNDDDDGCSTAGISNLIVCPTETCWFVCMKAN